MSDSPTLFDFGNPLELRVGSIAIDAALTNEAPAHEPEIAVETPAMPDSAKNITAELERLLEERSERPPPDGTAREKSASEIE